MHGVMAQVALKGALRWWREGGTVVDEAWDSGAFL